MAQSALGVFKWVPDTPRYSDAFHALYDAFWRNKSWSWFTLEQVRGAVSKAISGKADDPFSACLQDMFERYKGRVSELIDYLDFKFDRTIVREKFKKFEHICPMLTGPGCGSKVIGYLLDPTLEDMDIIWRFEWDEVLMGGVNMSMGMDPLRRFTSLFDFFSSIEAMGERGEPAVIVQMDFLFQWGVGNCCLELSER